jgi:hypothetical protein
MPSAWFRPPVHNAAPPWLPGVLEKAKDTHSGGRLRTTKAKDKSEGHAQKAKGTHSGGRLWSTEVRASWASLGQPKQAYGVPRTGGESGPCAYAEGT